jgi:hypothetical protein
MWERDWRERRARLERICRDTEHVLCKAEDAMERAQTPQSRDQIFENDNRSAKSYEGIVKRSNEKGGRLQEVANVWWCRDCGDIVLLFLLTYCL